MFDSMTGLYALAPTLFPTRCRSAGISLGVGIGRIGGMIAPALAGVLFESGILPLDGYILFAMPLFGVAVAVLILGRKES